MDLCARRRSSRTRPGFGWKRIQIGRGWEQLVYCQQRGKQNGNSGLGSKTSEMGLAGKSGNRYNVQSSGPCMAGFVLSLGPEWKEPFLQKQRRTKMERDLVIMHPSVKNFLYGSAKTIAKPLGLYPFPKTYGRHLRDILRRLQINCVLDVGAHFGEWVGSSGRSDIGVRS
jgi:hypothetical protein